MTLAGLLVLTLTALYEASILQPGEPYPADQRILPPYFEDQLRGVNLLLETYLVDKASLILYS